MPEVETTLRGIQPYLLDAKLTGVTVRNSSLRWPVPVDELTLLVGERIVDASRRAKYLLIELSSGTLLIHLGMSGSLRVLDSSAEVGKHDHIDLELNHDKVLRFNDPRRFGSFLLTKDDPLCHPLLVQLGPEPLTDEFDGNLLFSKSRQRKIAVKNFIMNGHIVVGVGNIYASEALFMAGVRPTRAANKVTRKEYALLAENIKRVLARSIKQGGTTLRDFTQADGQAGYFKQQLQVYDRDGEPCRECQRPIEKRIIGQRSSFYCPVCQK